MADIALLPAALLTPPGATDPAATDPAGILLAVLETAQRMVAYVDNAAAGRVVDPELAVLGLTTPKLDCALRDLREAVHAMNRALSTEQGCDLLASLSPRPPARRRVA
jgi:hypothetical protein